MNVSRVSPDTPASSYMLRLSRSSDIVPMSCTADSVMYFAASSRFPSCSAFRKLSAVVLTASASGLAPQPAANRSVTPRRAARNFFIVKTSLFSTVTIPDRYDIWNKTVTSCADDAAAQSRRKTIQFLPFLFSYLQKQTSYANIHPVSILQARSRTNDSGYTHILLDSASFCLFLCRPHPFPPFVARPHPAMHFHILRRLL